MITTRNYEHRTFGVIGAVTLETAGDIWTLDGKVLPNASVYHLMTFALQSLQDAYAGAKTVDEAKAAFEKKYDRLLDGTLGTREATGVSTFVKVARQITRQFVKAKFGGKSPEWAKFTGFSDETQNEKLDAWFGKNEAILRPKVDEEIERQEIARKAKISLVSDMEIDL